MLMFRVVLVAATLAAAPVVAAPDSSAEALKILQKASDAARNLQAISYEARTFASGQLANRYPSRSGRVVAKRNSGDADPMVAISGAVTMPGAKSPVAFTFVSDGVTVSTIDVQTKTFTSGRPAKLGLVASNPLFPPRYLHEDPFKDIIDVKTAKHEGTQTIDGVECNVISVRFPQSPGQSSRLFFGMDDFLLRRINSQVSVPNRRGGPPTQGSLIFTADKIDTKAKPDEAVFHLTCPPGYQNKPLKRQGPPGLLPVGSEAPAWELKSSTGQTVSLAGLRGKVVVLDFWATWCGPCRMAMPGLQKLSDRFKGKPVAVYGVNCMERQPNADPAGFFKKMGMTYGLLLDGTAVAEAYNVSGIPCFYVIGPDGKVLNATAGFSPRMEAELGRIIEAGLAQIKK